MPPASPPPWPSISAVEGIRPADSSSSSLGFDGGTAASTTDTREAPRMGAPASPPMNVGSSSSRESALSVAVHVLRSPRKSLASAFDLARAAGSSGNALAPSAVILALTTEDVCGKPSCDGAARMGDARSAVGRGRGRIKKMKKRRFVDG